jgi:CheY-like chemotaxis protein
MDGFAVVEQLRADSATSGIPIVILTSRSMDPSEREQLTGQISHLARKGAFDRTQFVELVRKLCPLPGATDRGKGD